MFGFVDHVMESSSEATKGVELAPYEEHQKLVREALGEDRFEQVRQLGRTITVEEAHAMLDGSHAEPAASF